MYIMPGVGNFGLAQIFLELALPFLFPAPAADKGCSCRAFWVFSRVQGFRA